MRLIVLGALALVGSPQSAAAFQGALHVSTFVSPTTSARLICGPRASANIIRPDSSTVPYTCPSTSLYSLPAALSSVATSVACKILPSSPTPLSKALRLFTLLFTASIALSSALRRRVLYPGIKSDPTHSEPIPDGPSGCPFLGTPFFFNPSNHFGAGDFYRQASAKLGNPRVWRYYFMGQPFAVLSGNELKTVLNTEFDKITSSGVEIMDDGLMPIQSILFERNKSRHSFLRRLVGSALTPSAVSEAVPTLQTAAEEQVAKMLKGGPEDKIEMAKICNDYTLDVAWRQILGLDLPENEIATFEQAVEAWITGMMSVRVLLRIAVKSSPGYKAMLYITSKIEEKIRELEQNGPDSSTLSGMLFAADEEDPSKTLSREEVIDNAKILIFAGSETSASTLTNAMLFLGLNPQAWKKLVEEQIQMKERHGDVLTKAHLDEECPYLEAVIREAMRMRTISGGIPRRTTKTLVVDGKQIPEGWLIDPSPLLTHELDPTTREEGSSHMHAVTGFSPERWLKDETKPSTDYMPFGYGPRYCLGSNLAMAEMKVFLATLARKISYKLDREQDIEWNRGLSVIAKPADGVMVTVKEAEHEMEKQRV